MERREKKQSVHLSRIALMASILCVGTGSALHAQTLDEFRTAAAADGVNVIPFGDLRREAASIADEVDRRKYEATKFNFDVLNAQKNNLLAEAAKTKDLIKKKQDEIDQFKKDHPDGSSRPLEDELETLKAKLDKQQDEVEDFNEDELEDAYEAWGRLWNARAGLREQFEKVVDKLEDVESNPASYLGSTPSDDDLAKLKNYLSVIENEIEVQAKTHREQEDGAKSTEQGFAQLMKRNEP